MQKGIAPDISTIANATIFSVVVTHVTDVLDDWGDSPFKATMAHVADRRSIQTPPSRRSPPALPARRMLYAIKPLLLAICVVLDLAGGGLYGRRPSDFQAVRPNPYLDNPANTVSTSDSASASTLAPSGSFNAFVVSRCVRPCRPAQTMRLARSASASPASGAIVIRRNSSKAAVAWSKSVGASPCGRPRQLEDSAPQWASAAREPDISGAGGEYALAWVFRGRRLQSIEHRAKRLGVQRRCDMFQRGIDPIEAADSATGRGRQRTRLEGGRPVAGDQVAGGGENAAGQVWIGFARHAVFLERSRCGAMQMNAVCFIGRAE